MTFKIIPLRRTTPEKDGVYCWLCACSCLFVRKLQLYSIIEVFGKLLWAKCYPKHMVHPRSYYSHPSPFFFKFHVGAPAAATLPPLAYVPTESQLPELNTKSLISDSFSSFVYTTENNKTANQLVIP
mgnify:CR=1 FL=1